MRMSAQNMSNLCENRLVTCVKIDWICAFDSRGCRDPCGLLAATSALGGGANPRGAARQGPPAPRAYGALGDSCLAAIGRLSGPGGGAAGQDSGPAVGGHELARTEGQDPCGSSLSLCSRQPRARHGAGPVAGSVPRLQARLRAGPSCVHPGPPAAVS